MTLNNKGIIFKLSLSLNSFKNLLFSFEVYLYVLFISFSSYLINFYCYIK
jgi:hypothetical protein